MTEAAAVQNDCACRGRGRGRHDKQTRHRKPWNANATWIHTTEDTHARIDAKNGKLEIEMGSRQRHAKRRENQEAGAQTVHIRRRVSWAWTRRPEWWRRTGRKHNPPRLGGPTVKYVFCNWGCPPTLLQTRRERMPKRPDRTNTDRTRGQSRKD